MKCWQTASICLRLCDVSLTKSRSPRTFAKPVEDKTPSYARPTETTDEGFCTASVPSGPAGGAAGEALYGGNPAVNVFRATSLVPDEVERVIALIATQYFPGSKLMDLNYDNGHGISRAQVELVATKVSEQNKCFY